ncbi:MAG: DinB family protein [Fimbriimonas ginsengisoli]|uniref:DinB family protein n=1 Tax=Fimbriimonas ginsengisoli TaxID=1005039 RepID=A0A931LW18_FIMGI|nr:DinB family protein [Fimbriimonas ginsengisoli]
MSEFSILVKKDWEHFFSIVNTEEAWIIPLLSAVDSVTYEQAFWRPGGQVASIADIMMHATGWLESTLRGVLGMPELDNEDWPEPPAPSEAAWSEMVARLKATVLDLSRALHNLSLEELYSTPTGRETKRSTMITDILVHNAYHAGQIVKLRQAHDALETAGLAATA